ncbi:acyl carrier protein [Psychrobacter immobilis]|uniref:acyl carrier protein n=1 Tax=Psychrobacter immobilis TaxID=498 RepID=UPI00191AC89A|nr:acyl carrier protein [Psychrobacter immobilis]
MDKEQIMQIVSTAIEDTFMTKSNEISGDTVAIDIPGWDSLSHIILLSNIEDSLNAELDLEDVEFENVAELVEFIYKQLN